MTTTMLEMREVVSLVRQEGLNAKIMIGGAVVNADYAKEIVQTDIRGCLRCGETCVKTCRNLKI